MKKLVLPCFFTKQILYVESFYLCYVGETSAWKPLFKTTISLPKQAKNNFRNNMHLPGKVKVVPFRLYQTLPFKILSNVA